jgi:hypothetical protein
MIPQPSPLSKRKLALRTILAFLAGAVIALAIVLPAEYGVDPLGVGGLMGLNALSERSVQAVNAPPGATVHKPVQEGAIGHYAASYKADSAQFNLGPYEYVEYKYRLEKGAAMLYSWTASAAVIHNLHGAPDEGPPGKEESFDKQDRREGNGAFTAPFSGIHGWYWENPGGEMITVTLSTAGFYSAATEFRFDRTRRDHDLTVLKPPLTSDRVHSKEPETR